VRRRSTHEPLDEARLDWIGQRHDVLAHGSDPGLSARVTGLLMRTKPATRSGWLVVTT
jgi:hypothetical protein